VEKAAKQKESSMKIQLLSIVLIAVCISACAEQTTTVSTASAEKTVATKSLKPRAKIILEKALKSKNGQLRSAAIEVTVEAGQKDMLPHITRLTRDPVVPVRFNATIALGDMRCPGCEKNIRKGLNDADVNVRIAAAYSLAKLNQPQFVEMIRAAAKSKDQTVRANAALLLGKLGNPDNIELLYEVLQANDSIDKVRLNAVESIARLGDERMYRSKLWALLISKFPDDRVIGIRGMGALNTSEAKNAIITMLQDDILEVRLTAAEQLARMGDNSGEEQIFEYFQTQPNLNETDMANQTAVMAIGPLNSSRLNSELSKALDSRSPKIQLLAARSVLIQLE
jgi:HEAT repeat protein